MGPAVQGVLVAQVPAAVDGMVVTLGMEEQAATAATAEPVELAATANLARPGPYGTSVVVASASMAPLTTQAPITPLPSTWPASPSSPSQT